MIRVRVKDLSFASLPLPELWNTSSGTADLGGIQDLDPLFLRAHTFSELVDRKAVQSEKWYIIPLTCGLVTSYLWLGSSAL